MNEGARKYANKDFMIVSIITFTIIIVTIIIVITITTFDMGNDKGAVMSMKNLVSHMVLAPTANPCREQIAWTRFIMMMHMW